MHAHSFFSTRYDPFMPVCVLCAALGDAALVIGAREGSTRASFGAAVLSMAGGLAVSLVTNVPVNRWIRTLDPKALPPGFASRDPRRRWGAWNRARFVLAFAALLINCLGAALVW